MVKRKPRHCRTEHRAQPRCWVGGTSGPGGLRSWRGCSGQGRILDLGGEFSVGDKEGQSFLWVRSKGENQGTKPQEEGEEGAGEPALPSAKSICTCTSGYNNHTVYLPNDNIEVKRAHIIITLEIPV